ncbi:MAG: TonB-dependent receptor [Pseudomonadota bacterium]|nr:TonB-dependent receptor [Pseudomonadota bacterium]
MIHATKKTQSYFASVSLAAFAASLGLAASPAVAQPEETGDEVLVTGFRGSLGQALNVKKNEVGAVDAILAEDIADFPDLNLAEAIQRVPGVSIDRDAGEGRQITVRGLNPDFTRVRINGMETLSTTGGTDSSGGTNRGRGFDFNIFASELFKSITVRKTSMAEIEEGSLGATVDLATARPFDFDDFTFALSGQASYNTLSEKAGPRVAALLSKSWNDETFGILVSAAYSDRSLLEEGFSTVRWDNAGAFSNEGAFPGSADAFHPRIPRYGKLIHDQERLGVTGAIQWRPSESTLFNIDVLYSKFDATRSEQFLEAISFSRNNAAGKSATDIVDLEIDSDNNIVYGVFNDVDVRIENRFDELTTKFMQAGLTGAHEFSDKFRANFLIGLSESNFDNPVQTTIIADALDVDGYSWDFRDNNKTPMIDYNIDVTDPSGFVVNEARDRPNDVLNQFWTGQVNASFDLNEELQFAAGFSYKQFDYETLEYRRDCVFGSAACATTATFFLNANNSLQTSIDPSVGAPNGTDLDWVIPNIGLIADQIGLYTNAFPFALQNGAFNDVTEKDLGGFFQANLNTDLGAMPLRGSAGVRVVQTETASSGVLSNVYTTVENTYTDVLPSVTAVLEPVEDFLIRASVAKVMARPTLPSLTPGGNLNAFSRTLSFGNPQLDPFRAWSYDLSLEWYFTDEAVVAFAFFYKDIASFVTRQTDEVMFSDLGLDPSLLIGSPSSPSDIFDVTRNVNGEGGKLHGFEVQYQQPFVFLPGFLSNTGFTGNYTYVDSEVNYGTQDSPNLNQLTGLSQHAFNATVYYEDDRLSARVATSYRSPYLTTYPGRNGNDEEGKNKVFSVDASVSYAITDRLKLTLEGVNLTDAFNYQYVDTSNRVSVYHHTGRELLFGVRWAM